MALELAEWEMVGPTSPLRIIDADKDWVVIEKTGECNRDIDIPVHVAEVQERRIKEWLEYDLADYSAFSMCHLLGANCSPGFMDGYRGACEYAPKECPFAVVHDESLDKWACCYTIIAGGLTVYDVQQIICDYIDKEGKAPRYNDRFRDWARAMMNFYKKKKLTIEKERG